MKHKNYWKEIRRNIAHSMGRILAITGIVALGAGFLAGLSASEPVMKRTADKYFEDTRYMDIKIQSTLGLTEADIQALAETEGVLQVEPSYMLDLLTAISGEEGEKVVRFSGMPEKMNELILLNGRMPESEDECVVNPGKVVEGGIQLGDELTVQEDGLKGRTYRVVGLVNSAQYLSMTLGSTTKGNGRVNMIAYLPQEQFDQEFYTIAYVRAADVEGLSAFSDVYEARIDALTERLEQVGRERAQLRYEEMLAEGQEALKEARSQYQDEKSKADEEIHEADADLAAHEKELADGQKKVESGQKQLEKGASDLAAAWDSFEASWARFEQSRANTYANLEEGRQQLKEKAALLKKSQEEYAAKETELLKAQEQLTAAQEELTANRAQLEQWSVSLEEEMEQLDAAYQALQAQKPQLSEEEYEAALAKWQEQSDAFFEGQRQLAAGLLAWETQQKALDAKEEEWQKNQAALEAAKQQLAQKETELSEAQKKLEDTEAAAYAQLENAEQRLISVKAALQEKEAELEKSQQELAEGKEELKTAAQQIEEGQKELESARAEAEEALAEAWAQIEEGQDKLADIPKAEWYVLDRQMDESFVSYSNDAERMGKIATVFPWMFFVVAALVSLTTMTRMVEEERLLIGTYKALGFSNGRIMLKYLVYAGSACLLGAVLGIVIGFQVLPRVVCAAYGTMYMLPETQVRFYWGRALVAGGAALLCTMGATASACLHCLRSKPAALMQPAAPKAGKRIFLERITPLWKHMSFIKKVTARNLFRYKKRLFMTVIGIAGCTGLLLTGFGLKDSVMDIVENQYHHVYTYDGILGVKNEEESRKSVAASDSLADYLYVSSKMADIKSEEATVAAYLYVPEDEEKLNSFIHFQTRVGQQPVTFDENTIVITEKLAERLGVEVGSVISLKDSGGMDVALTVGGITENYLYNYVYLPKRVYEEKLEYELQYNQILFKAAQISEPGEAVRQELTGADGISTVQLLDDIIEPVRKMIRSLNLVVMVLIVSAGLLAFIVLYNLTNINITERQREIATIKVLGFHPMEVSAYIYRETMVLTLIGCLLGLLVGIVMHRFVITTVEVDMVMFGRSIHGIHFVWAALITFLFSAFVDFVMHFKLKKISMVDSLKSVE